MLFLRVARLLVGLKLSRPSGSSWIASRSSRSSSPKARTTYIVAGAALYEPGRAAVPDRQRNWRYSGTKVFSPNQPTREDKGPHDVEAFCQLEKRAHERKSTHFVISRSRRDERKSPSGIAGKARKFPRGSLLFRLPGSRTGMGSNLLLVRKLDPRKWDFKLPGRWRFSRSMDRPRGELKRPKREALALLTEGRPVAS